MFKKKQSPLYHQVEEFVREKVVTKEYPPFSKIPSISQLLKQTGTSYCTVQAALAQLRREGLLESRIGDGTYVCGDSGALHCMGIYLHRPMDVVNVSFYRVLVDEITSQLAQEGVKVRVWMDERELNEQATILDGLDQAIRQREIQGLVVPLLFDKTLDWLPQVPVATAMMQAGVSLENTVGGADFYRPGLESLHAQGCRRVGVLTNAHFDLAPEEPGFDYGQAVHRTITETSLDLGLEVRDDWICGANPTAFRDLVRFGYDSFHALWAQSERPDGLLVFPDTVASGVILAMLELQLRVPEDLHLAIHANEELPLVCPYPATLLQLSIRRYAEELIQMVRQQLAGESVSAVSLPYTIVTASMATASNSAQ